MKKSTAIALRIVISFVVGFLGSWLISESSYFVLKDPDTRDTVNRITLVIPQGTAERIAAGEDVLSLPSSMSFVEGDLLVVKNEDSVSHQLGPVWVPPQSSGVLEVGSANTYTYSCSFQTSSVFGIDVRPALTSSVRFGGIFAMALPTSVMLALYSFLVFPIKPANGDETPLENPA